MSMKTLQGKSILITGAAGGLGIEYARQFLELGAHLILTDLDQKALDKTASGLPTGPGKLIGTIAADISNMAGCEKLHQESKKLAPNLDMLLNNAGLINYGYFWEIPRDKWELLMAVNLLAPMRLCQLFIPDMVERKSGQIVFMCSVAGFAATSLGTPYVTSKFGMRGFAMALSGEMKDKGLDVTIIYPSWVKTKLLDSPEFGSAKVSKLSSFLTEDPVKVVREAIKGIRKNKLHVCPGLFSKIVWQGTKAWPIVSRQSH